MSTMELSESDCAILKHRLNTWDKSSMNLKINEITEITGDENHFSKLIDSYDTYCVNNDVDVSIIKVEQQNETIRKLLIKKGFVANDYSYEIQGKNIEIKNNKTLKLEKKCKPQNLSKLVDKMFYFGRFTEDLSICKELSNNRNICWALDLLNEQNEKFFLYKKNNLVGFMFCTQEDKTLNLILGGVSERYKHLAPSFWLSVFSNFSQDVTIKTNISASNLGVVNLYSYFGFKFKKCLIGYHKDRRYFNES